MRALTVEPRPDPEPCRYCAAGEWDTCANGRYVERGIKGLDGYGSDYFCVAPEHWADALRKQPHDVKVVLDFTL